MIFDDATSEVYDVQLVDEESTVEKREKRTICSFSHDSSTRTAAESILYICAVPALF